MLLLFPHFNTLEQASNLRSWQIGRSLARNGHDVIVFAPGVDMRSGEPFPELQHRLYAEYRIEGVRLIRPRCISHFRRSALKRLIFELLFAFSTFFRALFLRKIDVVVVSYPPAVMPIFGLALAKLKRRPCIFEIRDLMADALVSTGYLRSRLFARFAKLAENLVVHRSDHIIVVSNGIKKALVGRRVDPGKVTVVTNGYEPEPFERAPFDGDPRAEFGWGDRFVVIYAGGLTQAYDIPTLIRAAERLRHREDMMFVVVGEGDRKREYQEMVLERKFENFQFVDYQPRKRMPEILSAADVGVHMFPDDPLWSYVLGNKPFDYFGSGIPMVFAGTGDTAELVEQTGGGFVIPPEDDGKLAETLAHMAGHPEEAVAMGERARKYVTQHYNRRELLRKFEATLMKLLSTADQVD